MRTFFFIIFVFLNVLFLSACAFVGGDGGYGYDLFPSTGEDDGRRRNTSGGIV